MSIESRLQGTFQALFQIATAQWKTVAGIIEARNLADSSYVIVRGADPVGNDDLVTRRVLTTTAGGLVAFASGITGGVPSGATRYMWPGQIAAPTVSEPQLRISRTLTLRNLTVKARVAPGAARTDTWTVRLNGANTALTTSLVAGAVTNADLANTVNFVAGDYFSIQCVTAVASATTDVVIAVDWVLT